MKHIKRFLALALLAVSLFAVALPAMAQPNLTGNAVTNTNPNSGDDYPIGSTAYIKGTNVNARSGPGTNYSVAFVTRQYEEAEILGTANSFGELWVWLEFPDRGFKNAWVLSTYVGTY